MRKKLFVLTAGAILASHFATTGNASAIVSGEPNEYVSKALEEMGDRNKSITVDQYKKNLDDLIYSLSIKDHQRFDEPEFKEAYKKYQDKFFAENDAMKKFLLEERIIEYHNKKNTTPPQKVYGLTHQRYEAVFNSLKQHKKDFEDEIKQVETKYSDLKTFDRKEQDKADEQVNELENKVLMLGRTFVNKIDERENLYNKLDLIMGVTDQERELKNPINERMLKERIEDLETIIDEFFTDIGLARPIYIPTLTAENGDNRQLKQQLRDDAKKAKENASLRHPRAFKNKQPSSANSTPVTYPASSVKAPEIQQPSANGNAFPTYTEEITQTVMPTLQQKQNVEIYTPKTPKSTNLPGQSGESSQSQLSETQNATSDNTIGHTHQIHSETYTTAPQRVNAPVEPVETITESNIVDIEENSYYQRSGYMFGYSESDTSGYTERDKRAIRRDHVREAEALVNQYVDTHKYQDRIAAQQKVNMLSEAHQKRFNKMIQRAYNGQ